MPAYEARRQYVNPQEQLNMMLRSPNKRDRDAAEAQLRYMQHQEQMGATRANLEESIAARMANQAEGRAARRQESGETRARLVQRDREIMQARQDALAQQKASAQDLKAQRVLAMLPILQQEAGTDKAKRAQITKSILDQYYQLTGVQNPLAGGAAGPTPGQQALRNVAPKLGQPVAQPAAGPAAGTPGGPQFPAVGAAGGPAPAQPEGRFAPGSMYGDEGGEAPERGQAFGVPAVQRNVEGGNIAGPLAQQVPAGYDLNINTGEYIPKGQEGTINGIPATQALVEGALRSGVAPIYSPKAMATLDQLQQSARPGGGFAGKPTLPVGPRGLPDIGTPVKPTLEAGPEGFRGHGAGSSWEGGGSQYSPSDLVNKPAPPYTGATSQFNIRTGFTPEAKETISHYLNLPGFPKHYEQGPTFATGPEGPQPQPQVPGPGEIYANRPTRKAEYDMIYGGQ